MQIFASIDILDSTGKEKHTGNFQVQTRRLLSQELVTSAIPLGETDSDVIRFSWPLKAPAMQENYSSSISPLEFFE